MAQSTQTTQSAQVTKPTKKKKLTNKDKQWIEENYNDIRTYIAKILANHKKRSGMACYKNDGHIDAVCSFIPSAYLEYDPNRHKSMDLVKWCGLIAYKRSLDDYRLLAGHRGLRSKIRLFQEHQDTILKQKGYIDDDDILDILNNKISIKNRRLLIDTWTGNSVNQIPLSKVCKLIDLATRGKENTSRQAKSYTQFQPKKVYVSELQAPYEYVSWQDAKQHIQREAAKCFGRNNKRHKFILAYINNHIIRYVDGDNPMSRAEIAESIGCSESLGCLALDGGRVIQSFFKKIGVLPDAGRMPA